MRWNEYWAVIKNAKTTSGECKYPNLLKFVSVLSSFPFSNAAVERIFSALKQIKTDRRSSLKSSSLVALLQSKMALKNGNLSAAKLQPSEHMLKLAAHMKTNATDEQVKKLRSEFLEEL